MKNLHCCTFIIVFSLFFPFFSVAIDTISPTKPLAGNQTLVSNGEVFEMGFFNRGNGNLYLGIWYKNVEMKEYVWVANRDAPINSSAGKLTIEENGKLVVVDQSETAVWWTNQSAPAVENMVGQLLDNGNFVVRRENDDDEKNYIWQSFDFPTDTLLPEMKIGWSRRTGVNRFLQSWKTATDPGSGEYSFKMNTDGFPEVFLLSMETPTYRSGPWNGRRFSGVPEMVTANLIEFEFENNSEEITYSFEMRNTSVYSRLIMNSSGLLQRFTWVETSKTWSNYWFAPRDQCDYYGECGPFGICDSNLSPVCKCPKGFRPKNQQAWDLRDGSGGCVRSSELDCGSDGFLPLKNMKLPVSSKAFVDRSMNLSRCEEICKRNCACAAYANMDITSGGSGCVIWAVDLFDMRQYADTENGGQDLYVRVAASDLDKPSTAGSSKSGSDNNVAMIVGITVGACAVLIILLILVYLRRKKLRRLNNSKIDKRDYSGETTTDELELPLFEFTTLVMATNNFSDANKLGQGGFGCVYKVRLIAKLQHRNLVRLLGCCIEVEEKLLIYEYMENKSLNTFLFSEFQGFFFPIDSRVFRSRDLVMFLEFVADKEKSPLLNWQRRFDIISGIARGLLYLHQDSRFRIIHRDLKASNILLDREMNPKISDFGMARIFGSDQTEAETKKVVGTHGYMSPEYAMDGLFSIKSDVFSFGVLVLEIVSGKKNRGFYYADNQLNLLGHIGLLCIQEQADDRPNMSKVLLMLSSEVVQLAQPKYPGFCLGKRHFEAESSSKQDESMTVNEITVTILDGR
ncbi:Apple-like protein [Cynara cardunculus var. scolymus]|uniref:Receptor-like serine/threonine-protein kinase n=1 Tax=Cynara cardunculus var. scolymus TaxID=59895 RepID=A0A103XF58_CYNCS|nr:Apple-like protein [Cynara cardunculus var. scolymus]